MNLSPSEIERLSLLSEECAEVIQIVSKIIRHGYNSYNPNDSKFITNSNLLNNELGDIEAILYLMKIKGDPIIENNNEDLQKTLKRKFNYLHHQGEYNDL
jgi:hypothetical protein